MVRPNKQGSYTMKYKRCTIGCCGDQLHKNRAYARHAVIVRLPSFVSPTTDRRPSYTHFLTSDLADGKNIQFTIRILSRPTFSIEGSATKEISCASWRNQLKSS